MLIDASEAATAAGIPSQYRAKGSEGRSQDCEGFRVAAGREASQGRATRTTRSSALCIDGDCERGAALAAALTNLGYDVELASNGEEGGKKILASRPNLVFYDASTLRMGGIEGCLELLEKLSQPFHQNNALPLVVLTNQHDRESNLHDGQPDKDGRLSGTSTLDGALKGGSHRAEPPKKGLTARERDVLTWAARGKTSAEIGVILSLSERTINFHCDNAMRHLDVINHTQAVAKAVATGIIAL